PLDISVNKPFKEMLRDLIDQKIFELESMEAFERWTVGDRHIMTTECVGNAFHQFHTHKVAIIHSSFCNVGLSLLIDSSLDYKIDIKGFENFQIGHWRQDLRTLDELADVGDTVDIEDTSIEFVHTGLE
ncbi:hypothetical protein L873DRAFT_1702852, partial [Choiromyces venosus 120613-1]